MYSYIGRMLTLMFVLYLGEAFVQLVPHFDASVIGSNVIVRDSIMFNSSQNLVVSYNKNGVQYISKYSIQSGILVLQIIVQTITYNPGLGGQPITALCVDNLQSQIMAFTGINYQLYLLNINTLSFISSSFSFLNISQMIWSPINNNIYIADNHGNFAYLDSTSNWYTNLIYLFQPGIVRISASPNFTYIGVSSVMVQSIYIFSMINNSLITSQIIGEYNTVAHEWYSNDILLVMPPTTGYIFGYNLSSAILNQHLCFLSGTNNVFSIHRHKNSNITDQLVIGSSSGQIIIFSQFDFVLAAIVNAIKITYSENINKIKYSKSSEKAILIFNTFIDSIDILMQCQIGYVLDASLNQCVLNVTNTFMINNLTITQLTVQQQKVLANVILMTTSNIFIKICNYLPGNRRILQPLFIFFVNFDDIQLYVYHQRQYDFVLDTLFQTVQTLQNQKWSLIKFEYLWGFIGFNTTLVKENFNTKLNYTSWKFIEVQGYSSGFMINTLNLFLSNILLVFLMFVVLRTVFFLLFKYQISKILRQYSFWPYLYFLMIDGNLQFLSYMYLCELQHFFSSNFSNKCGLVFMICIFLVLILLISCSHLLLRQTYGLLAKYFFEDTKTSFQASIYLILQFGYRNILLGAVHALFNKNYLLKISLLLSVQICFMINGLFFLKKRNFFRNQTRITVNIIAALLRICMIFTFIINTEEQRQILEMTTLSNILEKMHFIIAIVYLLIGTFSTCFQLSKMVYEVLNFIRQKQKNQKGLQLNKSEQLETFHFSSKQKKLQKSCIFQQFSININIIGNKYKEQVKKKGKTFKRFKLKPQFNKGLKIKSIKQFQTSKQVQHVTFAQNTLCIQN